MLRDMLVRAHERYSGNLIMRRDIDAFRMGQRSIWIEIDGSRNREIMAVADGERDRPHTPTRRIFEVSQPARQLLPGECLRASGWRERLVHRRAKTRVLRHGN